MSSKSETKSRFATVVPTVSRFPTAIMVFGSLLLVINVLGFLNFLFNLSGFVPDLGTGSSLQQLGFMMAGRQLGVAVVFALALFGKNVRFQQLAWFLAILREIADIAGTLVRGQLGISAMVAVILLVEIAIFIYLGGIASGHVAKYLPNKP